MAASATGGGQSRELRSLLSAASLHAAAAHARFPSAGYDRRRRLRREASLHMYIYSKAAPYRRTISTSRWCPRCRAK
jgi:hypothetical protein